MASLYKQKVNGTDYWYIREMARVNGKPKAISTIYLGTVANIIRMATEHNEPLTKIKSSSFGSLWLADQIERSFGLVEIVDGIVKNSAKDKPSVGEYFLFTVLNRMVDAVSKDALPGWFAKTAIQFIRPIEDMNTLDSRHFWRTWEKVDEEKLRMIAAAFFRKVGDFLPSASECVLFDTTNFYTFLDSKTDSELAKRGKNKQGRDWLRQIGLALLVDRGSKLPLFYQEYEGNCHDSKLFGRIMGDILAAMRFHGREEITIVVDKGMNAQDNFAAIDATTGVGFITTYAPSNAEHYVHVDMQNFIPVDTENNRELVGLGREEDRVLAWRTTGEYWGATRSVIVTYNPATAAKQRRAFNQKLAKLSSKLLEIAEKVNNNAKDWRDMLTVRKRITTFCKENHLREELYDVRFEEIPQGLRMYCRKNQDKIQCRLDWHGKNIIITSRTAWSTEDIVQASIDRYIVEESFRDVKDDRMINIRPIRHWTDSKIRCHILSCIMAEVYLRLIELKLADAGVHQTAKNVMRSMHELHSALYLVRRNNKPKRILDEPDELQASILAAFGYKITAGKMLPLSKSLPHSEKAPQKRGRPKGSKGKRQEKPDPPKRRGRPPKHLLNRAARQDEM